MFGLFRHYSGGLYLALGVVRDRTNDADGQQYVLYFSLSRWTFHIRTQDDFLDGIDGEPRFRRVFPWE